MIGFYAAHKLLVWFAAILLPVAGSLLYYFSFGPHTAVAKGTAPGTLVRRFGVRELLFHWLCLSGFVILMVTGLQQILSGSAHSSIGPFHGWLGCIFFIISLIILLGWFPDALFRRYDWLWIKRLGGYLSHNEPCYYGSCFVDD